MSERRWIGNYIILKTRIAYNRKSHKKGTYQAVPTTEVKQFNISCGHKKGKKVCGSKKLYARKEDGRMILRCEKGHVLML